MAEHGEILFQIFIFLAIPPEAGLHVHLALSALIYF